jgi:hypothetical protein
MVEEKNKTNKQTNQQTKTEGGKRKEIKHLRNRDRKLHKERKEIGMKAKNED